MSKHSSKQIKIGPILTGGIVTSSFDGRDIFLEVTVITIRLSICVNFYVHWDIKLLQAEEFKRPAFHLISLN